MAAFSRPEAPAASALRGQEEVHEGIRYKNGLIRLLTFTPNNQQIDAPQGANAADHAFSVPPGIGDGEVIQVQVLRMDCAFVGLKLPGMQGWSMYLPHMERDHKKGQVRLIPEVYRPADWRAPVYPCSLGSLHIVGATDGDYKMYSLHKTLRSYDISVACYDAYGGRYNIFVERPDHCDPTVWDKQTPFDFAFPATWPSSGRGNLPLKEVRAMYLKDHPTPALRSAASNPLPSAATTTPNEASTPLLPSLSAPIVPSLPSTAPSSLIVEASCGDDSNSALDGDVQGVKPEGQEVAAKDAAGVMAEANSVDWAVGNATLDKAADQKTQSLSKAHTLFTFRVEAECFVPWISHAHVYTPASKLRHDAPVFVPHALRTPLAAPAPSAPQSPTPQPVAPPAPCPPKRTWAQVARRV